MCDAFSVACGMEEPCENAEKSGYCDRVKNKDLCKRRKSACGVALVAFMEDSEQHTAALSALCTEYRNRLQLQRLAATTRTWFSQREERHTPCLFLSTSTGRVAGMATNAR